MRKIEPKVEILTKIDGIELLKQIETAGRTCYKSEDKITEGSAEKFAKMLITRGHEAMIEFADVSVRFTCDRGVTHEIVRHRLASYAQESTRYCNYNKDKFDNQITVIDIATGFNYDLDNVIDRKKYEVWMDAIKYVEQAYSRMIGLGASPQEARSVLPNSLKAEINVKMNLREWRHFFKMRASKYAHPQMQELAYDLLEQFKEKIPVVFDDLE